MRWFTPLWSRNWLNASAVVAKPFGTETPIPERLVIISPREAFLPPTLSTSFMPSWLYQSTSGDEPLLDIEQSFCDK
ncbi:Uncharacterised protein [Shigella sonnei]|nr:Uncharacterised protein [Shigella sonnei]